MVQQIRLELPRLGTRKLYYLLKDELKSIGVGRDRLFSILRANHMLIEPKRSYHITTDSHHRFRKHKNTAKNIYLTSPEQLWVSDITYVGHRQNPMYLALVTDAYSKKIMGYDTSNSLSAIGSVRALEMALKKREYSHELLHHSDRGLQYCGDDYQKVLGKYKLKCSMTEAYDPYENAVAERVNGVLKQEFLGNTKNVDLKTMQKLVSDSIKIYNSKRPHYSCYYKTPEQMHQQKRIKIRTYKSKRPSNDIITGSLNVILQPK
jgi:putative transposase